MIMGFDINTCKWVIWGAKNSYNTFGHIHEAFLRALFYLGKDACWLDNGDDFSQVDFSNTLFITMNCVLSGMPRRKDCFYVVHNILGDPRLSYLDGLKMLAYGVHISTNKYSSDAIELTLDAFFEPAARSLQFRWGTDLLPHEIEANKPAQSFNKESRVFNYVGTVDGMKSGSIGDFAMACRENGIEYNHYGYGEKNGPISVEEHIRRIQESYMAPAFQGLDQVEQGYVSCRLFKNISYGQFGITHSKFANDLFGGRLIYNPDAYRLFYEARERLQNMPVKELHDLMDEVAKNHTYLNKIDAITKAVRILEGA